MNLTKEVDKEIYSHNGCNASLNGSSSHQNPFSPTMDKAINSFTVIILFITMVSLGCTMEISKIKSHIVKPKGVAIAILAQFGIMPLTAVCVAKVFKLESMETVTVLIAGCCPGGNLSNIFSLALKGDMNLSIVMTTFSTVVALVMMPMLLLLYAQVFDNVQNVVPYTGIIIALILTLAPCGIGITINHHKPKYSPITIKVGLSICLVSSVAVGIMSGMTLGVKVWVILSPKLMAVAALMPLAGYTLGYVMSTLFKVSHKCRRTISMETGCQNIPLCATILKVAICPQAIGALYLFPLIYMVFQGGEALLFILLFRCYEMLKPPAEDKTMCNAVQFSTAEKVKVPALHEAREPIQTEKTLAITKQHNSEEPRGQNYATEG